MELINKFNRGLHIDNNEYDQPENTIKDSQNGVILDLDQGNFDWTYLNGSKLLLKLLDGNIVMGSCSIRKRYFILVLDAINYNVILYELFLDENGDIVSQEIIFLISNIELNLSVNNPIRSIFGYYENDDIQKIYLTDWNSQPRLFNIGSSGPVTIDSKFINFFPNMEDVYGNLVFNELVSGGNCKAGNYFFAWRLFKDGYYTDWSYLSNPIHVYPNISGEGSLEYQKLQGDAPDFNCSKSIDITINNIDDDYDSLQMCYFYSNDYNSAEPGVVFFEGDITGTEMNIILNGDEFIFTITIAELINTSIRIEKCKDFTTIKKYAVLSNITERKEIDVSLTHSQRKNNQLEISIIPIVRSILLDSMGYISGDVELFNYDAISGINKSDLEININGLIPDIYYYAVTTCTYTDTSFKSIPAGNVFMITRSYSVPLTSGTAEMVIVKKKYRKQISTNDINTYNLNIFRIGNGYFNYKNPLVSNELRGYPGGEKVRYGILFFDKTGRPYYARHLYNTIETYGGINIGLGDITFPSRNSGNKIYNTHSYHNDDATVSNSIYKHVTGNVLGVTISGIDITYIKDEIGGFSIVRAPIKREIISYGVLSHLTSYSNIIQVKPGFIHHESDVGVWPKGYSFSCPEDIFELTNFSIQPGDKLVNSYYLKPYYPDETEYSGFQGYGRRESAESYTLYQKYIIGPSNVSTGTNGEIGVEHEISFYTRYKLGDAFDVDIPIDPSDTTKLLRENTREVNSFRSFMTYTSIVIIKDLETAGINIKGKFNSLSDDPVLLVCYVKRNIDNSYGGLSDTGLSNTLYVGTGHYQVINDNVLSDIYDGSKYIFNEIDVFGGDSFISMFDFNRLLRNYDVAENQFNHSIILPIESRINLEMRKGRHFAKNRSYNNPDNLDGLQRITDNQKWEEFNYNDGYSSENISDYYLSLPNNFTSNNKFDVRHRFSSQKTYGEIEDSFRKFSALDYIDVDTEYGEINNIRKKGNRLIYWQNDVVGYIPIGERALTDGGLGQVVQLGVGGIFDRNDELITNIGNSNQFGLLESPLGFHWYDAKRKIYIFLSNNMSFNDESIIKGLDSFFVNDLPNDMYNYDNPLTGRSIISGYDIRNKIIFLTFRLSGLNKTIGYNTKPGMFIGFFDFNVKEYFHWNDWLYAVGENENTIYKHGSEVPGEYFGYNKGCSITFIVKDNTAIAKIFDNFEYIGSKDSFDIIKVSTSEQTIQESISLNRFIKFRNKRWFGSFPKVGRERLVDGYLKITLSYNGLNKVSINQFKTIFRKMI